MILVDIIVDVCFDEPKQVGKCAITTCFTGAGGELKVNHFSVVYIL